MKKTKVICTMGPNTNDRDMMRALIVNGMNIARFNFSHGDHEEQKGRMDLLKELRAEEDKHVAILLDTKGPEIRTGENLDGDVKLQLKTGDHIIVTTEQVKGTIERICVTYTELHQDVQVGSTILIDDGLVELKIESINGREMNCLIVNGGLVGQKKGVNVPNVSIKLPALTEKDISDIKFGAEQEVDFIAASFIRNAASVQQIRDILKEIGAEHIQIISKIENQEGLDNLDAIIEASDGIMVARGDLGVEIPAEQVPFMQKMMIEKCNAANKPVITATQMLDSMMRNPRATRAEIGDVANAVYDGSDAVMLSGETAQGDYPLEALQTMVKTVEFAEQHLDYDYILSVAGSQLKDDISSAIAYSSVQAASMVGAKAIITPSVSGATPRVISNQKPEQIIIGVTPNDQVLRKMSLYWGVQPVKAEVKDSTDDIVSEAIAVAKKAGLIETGDTIVITAGIPSENLKVSTSASSMMRITTVE